MLGVSQPGFHWINQSTDSVQDMKILASSLSSDLSWRFVTIFKSTSSFILKLQLNLYSDVPVQPLSSFHPNTDPNGTEKLHSSSISFRNTTDKRPSDDYILLYPEYVPKYVR